MDFNLYPPEYSDLIPAFTRPRTDELLSSWIVRLAKDHHLKVHEFCRILFPDVNIWNRDVDRTSPKELIKKLSTLTLVKGEDIENCLLSSYSGRLFSHFNPNGINRWILSQGIYHRLRLRKGTMLCPSCLRNDLDNPYFRKHWRLSLFTICQNCGCMLQDECPQCGNPINFFRNFIGKDTVDFDKPICTCHACKFDFRDSVPEMVSRKFFRMQRYFHNVLQGKNRDSMISMEYYDVLHQLVKIFNGKGESSILFRGAISKTLKLDFEGNDYKTPFDMLPVKQRLTILFASFWLLQGFPEKLIAFCKDNRIWSSPLLKDFNNPPLWYVKPIINNLYIANDVRNKEEFKKYFSYF